MCRGVAWGAPRRPEQLVLNPEIIGGSDVELLRCGADMHHVVDSSAAAGEGLENLRERGVVGARRMVAERESEGRKDLSGGWNGPLNEFPGRLLKRVQRAEQLGSERQRSAGAEGSAKPFTT